MANFTKIAIKNTFLDLLNKYPLEKITIKMIVDKCGINRNTFYYHYHDIYDLVDELFREETANIIPDYDLDEQSLNQIFTKATEFLVENRAAVNHIYNSVSRDALEDYVDNIFDPVVISMTKKYAEGLDVSDEDIKLISFFYKYAIQGYAMNWVKEGIENDKDFQQSIGRMIYILSGSLRPLLEKAASDKRSR